MEEESSSYQYTTTEKHIEDWFEENQWWVEDLSDENKIKLAQLFYIYQVYESLLNISIIPQDEEQRKKFAFCLLDKMGFTITDRRAFDATLSVINANHDKDKKIYTLSPFFLTSKDGAALLSSFTRFNVFSREDLKKTKETYIAEIKSLERDENELKEKEKEAKDEEAKRNIRQKLKNIGDRIKKRNAEFRALSKASLTASYRAVSDTDIEKLTQWFVNVDQNIEIFKEVYLKSNESKSLLNAFVYFIAKGKSLENEEIQRVKAQIITFMNESARSDGTINEWVGLLLQTTDEKQLTRMLGYSVFDEYFEDVKSLLGESPKEEEEKQNLIIKLVEALYKFVIYDEVKTHKVGKNFKEDNVKIKVNNIFRVQQIIRNPQNFNTMDLFNVILLDNTFNEVDYIMIKESYDAIEDLYNILEGRYSNKNDKSIKLGIANHYYNCLIDSFNIDKDKFELLNKFYPTIDTKNNNKNNIKYSGGKEAEVIPKFYNTMLYAYFDKKDNEQPYTVKFLYDIIYFATIQYRPDVFKEEHATRLEIWNNQVPYVVNRNKWWEDKDHYKIVPSDIESFGGVGTKNLGKDMPGFYENILETLLFVKYTSCSLDKIIVEKLSQDDILSVEFENQSITIEKLDKQIFNTANTEILQIIQELQKLTKNDDTQRRIRMLYCILSDRMYNTNFIQKTDTNEYYTHMVISDIINKMYLVAPANIKNLDKTINWGNPKLQYPNINFPVKATNDGSKKNRIIKYHNKNKTMDGASLSAISDEKKTFDQISFENTLLLVILLFKKVSPENYYNDLKDLELSELFRDKERINTFVYKEIQLKIIKEETTSQYKLSGICIDQDNVKMKFECTLTKEEIDNFNKLHTKWEEESASVSGNPSITSMINYIRNLLETLKNAKPPRYQTKELDFDIYTCIWNTLRRYQFLIDKHGYDNIKVRYLESSSNDGNYGMKDGEPLFTDEFVYNILLSVGYIYRNKRYIKENSILDDGELILDDINTKLYKYRINNTHFKIVVENGKSSKGTIIKVIEPGFMFNSTRAEVFIPDGMISDKEFKTFYMSDKVPVKTYNVENLNHELIQRYIWNVSFQIKDKRDLQEITTIDKLKSFFTPSKIIVGIVIMVSLVIVLESLNSAYIDYKYGEIPEFFRAQVPEIVKKIPESTKTFIKDIVNPLIESKSCSTVSSETCKVSLKDTVDNLINGGKIPVLYDNVVYTTMEHMKSIPSKIGGINLFDYVTYYFDKEFSGGIGRENFIGRADGTRKSIKAARKRSCKEYKRKKSKKVKAMLRRSARIQEQAKKLRKSLKKRRCDGSAAADLSSSCYVYKTAY